MLGICYFALTAAAVLVGLASGRAAEVSNAAMDGAAKAVELTLSLAGMTALWSGVLAVLREAGAIGMLSRVLAPVLRFVFPETWRREDGGAREEITAALSANLLGLGNAATPFALAAMEKLQRENPTRDTASADMITFAVLGTAPPNLLPTTLLTLRRAAGCSAPYRILLPVWIASAVLSVSAALLCRLAARAWAGAA